MRSPYPSLQLTFGSRAALQLLLAALSLAPRPALAGWPEDPAVNLPIHVGAAAQEFPAIAGDGAGGAIIAWRSYRGTTNTYDIYARRVLAPGTLGWGSDVPLCIAGNLGGNPIAVSDGLGGAIVAWGEEIPGSPPTRIYLQRMNANGSVRWTTNGVPIASVATDERFPSLLPDGAGGVFVAWEDYRLGVGEVFAQHFDSTGTALWTAGGVNLSNDAASDQGHVVVSDGAGGIIVFWRAGRVPSGNIYAQRVSPAGSLLWPTAGVQLTTSVVVGFDGLNMHMGAVSDGAGGGIVGWGDQSDLFHAQRVNVSGAPQWGANGVSVGGTGGDLAAKQLRMISDDAGGAIMAWGVSRSGARAVLTQRVNAGGTALWSAGGVTITPATGSNLPWIALAPDGASGAVITYEQNAVLPGGVYGQRIDTAGTPLWAADATLFTSSPGTGAASAPALLFDGSNGFIATWHDPRNGNSDIYAQRVRLDGTAGGPQVFPCLDPVVPGSGWTAFGEAGGPFSPSGQDFSFDNNGTVPVTYSVTRTQSWLSITGGDSATGTVPINSSVTVPVSLAPAATALPVGTYVDSVQFLRRSSLDTCVTHRTVVLIVGTLGITDVSPSGAPTTALSGGNPITVAIRGQLFDETAMVSFGGIPATVTRVSPAGDSIYATLPPYPPGENCFQDAAVTVPLTVSRGLQSVTAPSPFVYSIVRSRVPEDHPTIQAAMNAAIPGTCISVAPGVYRENVDCAPGGSPRTRITLTSRLPARPQMTRIEGGASFTPSLPVVRFSGNDSLTVLRGFEIVLGNSGVLVTGGAAPKILDNGVRNNFASGDGGGIAILGGSHPTVRRNRVDLNEAGGSGGGIAVVASRAVLEDNNVMLNRAIGAGGGLYLNSPFPIELSDLRVLDNEAGASGGGIYATSPASFTLDTCVIERNVSGGVGGGLCLDRGWPAALLRSDLEGNRAAADGGGIFVGDSSDVWIHGSVVRGNETEDGNGGGICLASPALARIVRDTVQDNRQNGLTSRGGGIFAPEFARGEIDSNVICGNRAHVGGAIAISRKATIAVTRNLVVFNLAERRPSIGGGPPSPGEPPFFAPAIQVFDAGPPIVNNTIHGNSGGSIEYGGGIDGERVGVFQPDWINNIVSSNGGWGIYCRGQNSGVRIDFNLGQGNLLGNFAPTIQVPGEPAFGNNLNGNPLYVDPIKPPVGTLNFHLLDVLSPAVDAGDCLATEEDPDTSCADIGAFYFHHSGPTADIAEDVPIVSHVSMTPNPFGFALNIRFAAHRPTWMDVQIVDLAGRRVMGRRLLVQPGTGRMSWRGLDDHGNRARPGVYFCRLSAGAWQRVEKIVMVQ